MKNPWLGINLSDYESHMKYESVRQLQALNAIMKRQFSQYPLKTVMVLGAAGGNGLEHIDPRRTERVFAADINRDYLDTCKKRLPRLVGVLECLCVDLTAEALCLPHADLLVADLILEYIGCGCFERAVHQVRPRCVSCVIQIHRSEGFVSDSPYLKAFDPLKSIHRKMDSQSLTAAMNNCGYRLTLEEIRPLPNGKSLLRLDYQP